ncbi:MAG: hypothetical protein ACTTIV_02550 [Campylobacter sp.]
MENKREIWRINVGGFAGNNWSRWCRNLVQKFSLKFSAQTAKSRINIGKFGDISLAFVRERKNEPKQKVANLYEKNCEFV